ARIPTGGLPADPFQSLAISPDATLLALCCRGDDKHCRNAPFFGFGLVRTWNLATGQEQEPVVVNRPFGWPIFLPDKERVLTARWTYDLGSGLPAESFNFYGAAGLGPDGRLWTFEFPAKTKGTREAEKRFQLPGQDLLNLGGVRPNLRAI